MDPNDKDNLPAIGMSNVLKKADSYDDNSAARDRRRKVCYMYRDAWKVCKSDAILSAVCR